MKTYGQLSREQVDFIVNHPNFDKWLEERNKRMLKAIADLEKKLDAANTSKS